MDLDSIKDVLREWASSNDYVRRVYIYGSRARADYRDDSDLDVVVEIMPRENDGNAFAVFVGDSPEWIDQLQPKLPYRLHLKGRYGEDSPDVEAGIERSSILVYEDDT